MKFKSIRDRITKTYTLLFVLTLLVFNVIIYLLTADLILESEEKIVYNTRNIFFEALGEVDKWGEIDSFQLEKQIEDVRRRTPNVYVRVVKTDGSIFGSLPVEVSRSKDHKLKNNKLYFTVKINEKDEDKKALLYVNAKDKREYYYLIDQYEGKSDNFVVEMLFLLDYEAYLNILIRVLLFVELLGIGISILVGKRVGESLVKPINNMSEVAERITSSNLGERIPIGKEENEIVRLSKLINSMLDRLEGSFERQQRFISNASHELRTPVAVMRGYLDVFTTIDDEVLAKEAIGAIDEESQNMEKIIEKLLFIARGELEGFVLNKNLYLVEDIFEKLKRGYTSIGVDINLKVDEDMTLECDIDIVVQILRAFVDNAIKYGSRDRVEVGGYIRGEEMILYVKDFGHGMEKEELEKIFERFYRAKDTSRESGSMGLGLSIVSKLSDVHMCKIEVDSDRGRGSEFRIVF